MKKEWLELKLLVLLEQICIVYVHTMKPLLKSADEIHHFVIACELTSSQLEYELIDVEKVKKVV